MTSRSGEAYWVNGRVTHHNGLGKFAFVLCLTTMCFSFVACAKAIDFSALEAADRIDVRTRNDVRLKEIVDPAQIKIATTFINDQSREWSESPAGPLVPDVMLYFFRGSSRLGGYGIAGTYIVADPTTYGWLSKAATPGAIDSLLRQLGIEIPAPAPQRPSK